jgi:hypothetical protein
VLQRLKRSGGVMPKLPPPTLGGTQIRENMW